MVYIFNNKDIYCIFLQIKQQRQILQMVYKSNNKDRYCISFTNLTIKTDIAYRLQI